MIEKAYELIQKKRIEPIGDMLYNVVGDHGTYTVGQKMDGTISCSCPGFTRKRRCSHSLAVLMLNQPSLLRAVKKEVLASSGGKSQTHVKTEG